MSHDESVTLLFDKAGLLMFRLNEDPSAEGTTKLLLALARWVEQNVPPVESALRIERVDPYCCDGKITHLVVTWSGGRKQPDKPKEESEESEIKEPDQS